MAQILNSKSRFKIWDRPATFPLADLIDRTAEGPVFDLDIELEGQDGAAYIKVRHVEEMARVLGWISPEDAAQLVAVNEALKNRVDNLPQEIERLKDGIDNCVGNFYDRLDSRPSFPVENPSGSNEADGKSESSSGISAEELGQGFGIDSERRSNDVPANSDDELGKLLT